MGNQHVFRSIAGKLLPKSDALGAGAPAYEHVTERITGFGERGPAERIALRVAAEVQRYLGADVPVGEHLADQLLLPMALGAGGVFRTLRPSSHCTSSRWSSCSAPRRRARRRKARERGVSR